ncbi:hypothetical protein KAU15_07590, partial [candidate division WOR-3 bacterium]|nr:hypothetical protein [candidate division WOR-3 bacterium]
YVAGGEGGLNIFDISDGANISLIKQFYSRWISEDVVVDSNYAYMAEGDSGLTIIDISNENNPIIVGDCDIRYFCDQVAVKDSMCVIGGQKLVNEREGIAIIDISNKSFPIMIDSIMHDKKMISFDLVDTILHCVGQGISRTYQIWNCSNMYNPVLTDSIIEVAIFFTDIVSDNNNTFISALSRDTIFIYDVFNKDSIDEIGVIRTESYGITMGYYSNYLFEIVNSPYKMYVYDCTDIMNPVEEGIYNVDNYAFDMMRNNNYIYISQGGGIPGGNLARGRFGLQIFGFNPTGIKDKQIYTKQENITITSTFNSINIDNQTGIPQYYTLTDITGRIINTIEAKSGITVITPKRSGIYFIISHNKQIRSKIIIMR